MAGSGDAAGASRKMINQGVGLSSKELQNSDKMIGNYLNPWAWGGYDMFRQARDELNNGSMTPYNWEQYVEQQGLAPGTSQQQFLKEYTPEDFGKAIGQEGWSLANLYDSMTPEDFRNTYGYDLTQAGKEYDPSRFRNQYGYDLSKVGTEYDASRFKNEVGYDLSQAGKQYNAGNFRDQYGYDLTNALQGYSGDQLQNDPGYQFRLNQGLQANDRLAAARGGVLGGGQLKAQERYAQDYAANEYKDAFARDQAMKQAALTQYNQANQADMTNRQGMLEAYAQRYGQDAANRQAMGQLYQGAYGQDLANRQAMMNQWNAAQAADQADLSRKQGLYFGTQQYKNLINQQQLQNYQANFDNTSKSQLQRQGFLMNLAGLGYDAAKSAAGMKQANTGLRVGTYTGGATTGSQNAWNQAAMNNSALSGLGNNIAGLAGMWMKSNSGNNNNNWGTFGGNTNTSNGSISG
jgi:hypothetical protein